VEDQLLLAQDPPLVPDPLALLVLLVLLVQLLELLVLLAPLVPLLVPDQLDHLLQVPGRLPDQLVLLDRFLHQEQTFLHLPRKE